MPSGRQQHSNGWAIGSRLGFDITSVVKEGMEQTRETPAGTEVQAGEVLPEWARRDSNARPLAPEGRPPAEER